MEFQTLIRALRAGSIDNHRCLGCGYEHNCSIHGCRVMNLAADELERLQKIAPFPNSASIAEKQAAFRLGQMDMRESVVAMLRDRATVSASIIRATLEAAAAEISNMGVME